MNLNCIFRVCLLEVQNLTPLSSSLAKDIYRLIPKQKEKVAIGILYRGFFYFLLTCKNETELPRQYCLSRKKWSFSHKIVKNYVLANWISFLGKQPVATIYVAWTGDRTVGNITDLNVRPDIFKNWRHEAVSLIWTRVMGHIIIV